MKKFISFLMISCLCLGNTSVCLAVGHSAGMELVADEEQSETGTDVWVESESGSGLIVVERESESENAVEEESVPQTEAAIEGEGMPENGTAMGEGSGMETDSTVAESETGSEPGSEAVTEKASESETVAVMEKASEPETAVATEQESVSEIQVSADNAPKTMQQKLTPYTYEGAINSELLSFSLQKTDTGLYYLSGVIVVVEWIDGESTVPKDIPIMRFCSRSGGALDVFVTPTGTNTYYFDRFIGELPLGEEYVFEVASSSENNVSANRKMNVLLSTSPQVASSALLGMTASQRLIYKMNASGELSIYAADLVYEGNINSELIKMEYIKGANGNYVSGQIVVVEWLENGTISTVPQYKPEMSFRSVDGLEKIDAFVTAVGTNTYYFDRLLEDLPLDKEYVFTITSGDPYNVAAGKEMIVNTLTLSAKEGVLWRTPTQYVCYRTDEATGQMRIYAIAHEEDVITSKKGIQGFEYREDASYQELGIKHVLVNIDLTQCIEKNPTASSYPVYYNGKAHYYTGVVNQQRSMVERLAKEGVEVTMVLLLSYDDQLSYLTYAGRGTSTPYYGWNVDNAEAMEEIEALLHFLITEAYPSVDHWIVGNEVNMPNHYNYVGIANTNVAAHAQVYAKQYMLLYNLLKKYDPEDKAYICLDHSWTHNDEGRGIAGKSFLMEFAKAVGSGVDWNVAYHAYAPIMTSSNIWSSGYSDKTENSQFISGYNIDVLTDFIRNNYGSNHRVILSEQGFTAANNSNVTQQAAALAYTYYAAQFNDMIDAVIFRSYYDDANDGIFRFGLVNAYNTDSGRHNTSLRRPAYNVFKYMDTAESENYTNAYLSTIGAQSWAQVIPNYDAELFQNLK